MTGRAGEKREKRRKKKVEKGREKFHDTILTIVNLVRVR